MLQMHYPYRDISLPLGLQCFYKDRQEVKREQLLSYMSPHSWRFIPCLMNNAHTHTSTEPDSMKKLHIPANKMHQGCNISIQNSMPTIFLLNYDNYGDCWPKPRKKFLWHKCFTNHAYRSMMIRKVWCRRVNKIYLSLRKS